MIRNVASYSFTPKTLSKFIFFFVDAHDDSSRKGTSRKYQCRSAELAKKQIFLLISPASKQIPELAICFALAVLESPFSEERRTSVNPEISVLLFF